MHSFEFTLPDAEVLFSARRLLSDEHFALGQYSLKLQQSDFREVFEIDDEMERVDINDNGPSVRALSRTKHTDCQSFLRNSSDMKI